MKKVSKLFLTALSGLVLAGSVYASDAYYGLPKHKATASNSSANAGPVVLYNYTYDSYMTYATFKPSNKPMNLPIGPRGSGTDILTYDINYPDYQVCVTVVRDFDHATVFSNCESSGNINIGPYANNGTSHLPIVRVVA